MLVLGLILSVFGIGFFCWLLFTLIVYALPFVVGLTVGMAAFHTGAGVIGALIVGVAVGALTLFVGQVAFASVRSFILRAAIALLYAVPAAIAGYHAVLDLARSACRRALARGVRLDRRAVHWRHGLGAHVAVRPAGSRAGRWGWSGSANVTRRRVQGRLSKRLVVVRFAIGLMSGRSPERECGRRQSASGSPISRRPEAIPRRRRCCPIVWERAPSFFSLWFLSFAWNAGPLVQGHRRPPRLLPRMLFGARTTRPLHGLIWPKGGCASIA